MLSKYGVDVIDKFVTEEVLPLMPEYWLQKYKRNPDDQDEPWERDHAVFYDCFVKYADMKKRCIIITSTIPKPRFFWDTILSFYKIKSKKFDSYHKIFTEILLCCNELQLALSCWENMDEVHWEYLKSNGVILLGGKSFEQMETELCSMNIFWNDPILCTALLKDVLYSSSSDPEKRKLDFFLFHKELDKKYPQFSLEHSDEILENLYCLYT